jgi:hypothetical protein
MRIENVIVSLMETETWTATGTGTENVMGFDGGVGYLYRGPSILHTCHDRPRSLCIR